MMAFVLIKGRQLHTGQALRMVPWSDEPVGLEEAELLSLLTNEDLVWRVGFVNYPSQLMYRREVPDCMFPPTGYGSSGSLIKVPKGLGPYFTGGGARLFKGRKEMLKHSASELVMDITNRLADMGMDAEHTLNVLNSNGAFRDFHDKEEIKTSVTEIYTEDIARKDCLLNYHLYVAERFLLHILSPAKGKGGPKRASNRLKGKSVDHALELPMAPILESLMESIQSPAASEEEFDEEMSLEGNRFEDVGCSGVIPGEGAIDTELLRTDNCD